MLTLNHVDKALVGLSSDCEIFANLCLKLYRWRSHIAYTILTALVWPKSGWSKVGKSTRNAAAIYKTPLKNCRGHVMIAGQCLPREERQWQPWSCLWVSSQQSVLHAILTFDTRVVTRCPRAPGAEKCDEMLKSRMCNLFERVPMFQPACSWLATFWAVPRAAFLQTGDLEWFQYFMNGKLV